MPTLKPIKEGNENKEKVNAAEGQKIEDASLKKQEQTPISVPAEPIADKPIIDKPAPSNDISTKPVVSATDDAPPTPPAEATIPTPSGEAPPADESILEPVISAPPVDEKRTYPPVITTKEPEEWGKVPMYAEKPSEPPPIPTESTYPPHELHEQDYFQGRLPPIPMPNVGIEPHNWLHGFLNNYKPPLKKQFIDIITDHSKIKNELPTSAALVHLINSMDSGISKNFAMQGTWIAEVYEEELKRYQEKKGKLNFSDWSYEGIPFAHMNEPYVSSADHYNKSQNRQLQQGGFQQRSQMFDDPRVLQLEAEVRRKDEDLRRRDDEKRLRDEDNARRSQSELFEIMMLQQGQKQPDDLDRLLKLKEIINPQKSDDTSNLFVEQLIKNNEKLDEEIKSQQRARTEQVSAEVGYMRNSLATMQEENRKMRQTAQPTGMTLEQAISLKKLDLDFDLANRKIENEKENHQLLGNIVERGASLVGEGIGRGYGLITQGGKEGTQVSQQQQQQSDMWALTCPSCGSQLDVPVGTQIVTCPVCNAKSETQPTPNDTQPSTPSNQYPPPTDSNLPQNLDSTPADNTVKKWKCPKCSAAIFSMENVNEAFCSKCGMNFPMSSLTEFKNEGEQVQQIQEGERAHQEQEKAEALQEPDKPEQLQLQPEKKFVPVDTGRVSATVMQKAERSLKEPPEEQKQEETTTDESPKIKPDDDKK